MKFHRPTFLVALAFIGALLVHSGSVPATYAAELSPDALIELLTSLGIIPEEKAEQAWSLYGAASRGSLPTLAAPDRLSDANNPICKAVIIRQSLRPGMNDIESGGEVSLLQRHLDEILGTALLFIHEDGFFGSRTQRAVERYQTMQGIVSAGSPDSTGYGMVGPRTRAALATCRGAITAPPLPPIPPDRVTSEKLKKPEVVLLTPNPTKIDPDEGVNLVAYYQNVPVSGAKVSVMLNGIDYGSLSDPQIRDIDVVLHSELVAAGSGWIEKHVDLAALRPYLDNDFTFVLTAYLNELGMHGVNFGSSRSSQDISVEFELDPPGGAGN